MLALSSLTTVFNSRVILNTPCMIVEIQKVCRHMINNVLQDQHIHQIYFVCFSLHLISLIIYFLPQWEVCR